MATASEELHGDARCGTCKHWRPAEKRDRLMDRHYGLCEAPLPPRIPEAYGAMTRFSTSSITGGNCPAWKAGGKHGALK